MPPKKVQRAIVTFATRTITIDGKEVRYLENNVTIESESGMTVVAAMTLTMPPSIIREFRAFEEEMYAFAPYGVTLQAFYQMLLHADTLRKITLTRVFRGLVGEPAIVERIVQCCFANHLVTAYRGGYRKTMKCLERLQRLHDPEVAPVGSHAAHRERTKKQETQWMGETALEQWLTTLLAKTELTDQEIARELRTMRADAIKKNAPKAHIARLDEEIKTYTPQQSEVAHVTQQAKELSGSAHGKRKGKIRIAKPSTKDVYLDDVTE